jgi:hypothetical protein
MPNLIARILRSKRLIVWSSMLVLTLSCSDKQREPADGGFDAAVPDLGEGDAAFDGGQTVLSLGTAIATNTTCPSMGAPAGATCQHLTIDCSAATGAPPLGVTVVITEPSGTLKGSVFLHSGSDGTTLATSPSDFLSAGLRTIAVAWDSEWEQTPTLGILAAACRPATLMKWAFDTPHHASRQAAFCAQGESAGSGVISYALAHYGMDAYLDYASLVSGPPFGRIDYGCAPATYTGVPRAVCTGQSGALDPAPYTYSPGPITLVNTGENTTTCTDANPPLSDVARWKADSIVSPGALYDYPKTPLRFFYCTSATTNEVTGLGSFYYELITSTKSEGCYTSCTGEEVAQDPAGATDITSSMLTNCVPRHQ